MGSRYKNFVQNSVDPCRKFDLGWGSTVHRTLYKRDDKWIWSTLLSGYHNSQRFLHAIVI